MVLPPYYHQDHSSFLQRTYPHLLVHLRLYCHPFFFSYILMIYFGWLAFLLLLVRILRFFSKSCFFRINILSIIRRQIKRIIVFLLLIGFLVLNFYCFLMLRLRFSKSLLSVFICSLSLFACSLYISSEYITALLFHLLPDYYRYQNFFIYFTLDQCSFSDFLILFTTTISSSLDK